MCTQTQIDPSTTEAVTAAPTLDMGGLSQNAPRFTDEQLQELAKSIGDLVFQRVLLFVGMCFLLLSSSIYKDYLRTCFLLCFSFKVKGSWWWHHVAGVTKGC